MKRNEVLTDYGQTEHHIYFIYEGAVCAFYAGEEEEKVIRFGYKG
ncbi:MAG: Crp/Fnr family transcriptional regulator, partial [Flavobacteriales bacterium]|nr:Crp/Fnr family transcriptional regulator [Flavobacteriales bacterium]